MMARIKLTDDQVLDLTDQWHEGAGKGQELYEYFGWTEPEYARWVETNRIPVPLPEEMSLDDIMDEIRTTEATFANTDGLKVTVEIDKFPCVLASCIHHRTMRGGSGGKGYLGAFANMLVHFREAHDHANWMRKEYSHD